MFVCVILAKSDLMLQIAAGRITWKNCVVIWLNLDTQNSKAQFETVSRGVKQVIETVIESLGQGMVTQ